MFLGMDMSRYNGGNSNLLKIYTAEVQSHVNIQRLITSLAVFMEIIIVHYIIVTLVTLKAISLVWDMNQCIRVQCLMLQIYTVYQVIVVRIQAYQQFIIKL